MSDSTAESSRTPEQPQATPELSRFIDELISSSSLTEEATICDIRALVLGDGIFMSRDGELMYKQDRTFLIIELDELIEELGPGASARELLDGAAA